MLNPYTHVGETSYFLVMIFVYELQAIKKYQQYLLGTITKEQFIND